MAASAVRWFVKQVEECTDQKSLFIADGATAHKAELFDSQKLRFEKLTAACPELNPVERFSREVRRKLKNRVFKCLQEAQSKIEEVVRSLFGQEGKVVSLTCFPYLKNTTL